MKEETEGVKKTKVKETSESVKESREQKLNPETPESDSNTASVCVIIGILDLFSQKC